MNVIEKIRGDLEKREAELVSELVDVRRMLAATKGGTPAPAPTRAVAKKRSVTDLIMTALTHSPRLRQFIVQDVRRVRPDVNATNVDATLAYLVRTGRITRYGSPRLYTYTLPTATEAAE